MATTLETTTEQLARALILVDDLLSDPRGGPRRLLGLLGWDLPPGVDDIGLAAIDLSSVIDKITALDAILAEGTATDIQMAAAYAGVLTAVAAALTDLGNLAASFSASSDYLQATDIQHQFFPRLLDLGVIGGTTAISPAVTALAQLCGVFVFEPHDADPTIFQVAHVRNVVRWDRAGRLLTDPGGLFREVYGWGTVDFDADALILNLATVFQAFGVASRTRSLPRRAEEQLAGRAMPEADTHPALQLLVSLVKGLGFDPLDVGISLYGLRPTTPGGADGGVGVSPYAQGSADARFPLSDRLALVVDASVDMSQGVAFLLRPDAPPAFRVDLGSSASGAAGGSDHLALMLAYAADTDKRLSLLTLPGGIRLEAGQLSAGGGLRSAGSVDAFFSTAIGGGRLAVTTDQTDGFLARLLPADGLAVDFEFGLQWSRARGVSIQGSVGLDATIGLHSSVGPFRLETLHIAVRPSGQRLGLETSVTGSGVLGPVTATVDRIGLTADVEFQHGNLGPVDLRLGFKPPSGVGVMVDAGPIVGGGFLFIDEPNGRYAGVLELKLYEVTVKAIGLIDTRLPDGSRGFSFLIVITTEFTPIQLGFGFTLNGVGGLAGINRTMLLDVLRAGVRAHTLDSILFPEDPVRDAPRIISDLRAVFPPAEGRYVFGPMLKLGWGTPTLIEAQVGVVLELPAPVRLAILGQVEAALPTEDAPLVELHLDVVGTVDFGARKLAIDASLYDSRIAVWSVLGDAALRLDWGDEPSFVFSVGGFHPQFKQLPAGFPSLRRLTASVGSGNNPRFSLDSYFAITSNTVQFGAHAELYAALAGFELHGFASFDALIVLSPFGFVTDLRAGVDLSFEGIDLFGVHLDLMLAGPAPWVADGSASFDILFWTISVHVHVQFGPDRPPPLPRKKVLDPLAAALANPQSWSAVLPEGAERAVSLAAATPGDTTIAVHPLGRLTARQTVVPLATPITRFAGVAPDDGDTFRVASATINGQPEERHDVTDLFARGQYMELSDADKLAAQPYERFSSGVSVGGTDVLAGRDAPLDVRYETVYVPDPFAPSTRGPVYGLAGFVHFALAEQGAAALSAVRATGMAAYTLSGTVSAVRVTDARYVVASTDDLSIRYDLTAAAGVTQHMAAAALAAHVALHPEEAGSLQVLPAHEAVGVPG